MLQTIALIGPPGSGKSSVAELLAAHTGLRHVDTDREVVSLAGMSIQDIFSRHGEGHFRDLERQTLQDLRERALTTPLVISCGGGLPVREENYRILESMGTIIALSASAAVLCRRLRNGEARPLLQSDSEFDKERRITELLSQRSTTYSRPRYRIDTSELTADEVCREVISLLGLV